MRRRIEITLGVVVTAIAAVIFSVTLVHAAFYAPEDELTVSTSTPSASATTTEGSGHAAPSASKSVASDPSRLIIPSLNINANVQYVGIAKSGHMAVPNNYTDVGWYRLGSAPGQSGVAVMDGHVDNGFALPGVFKHLSDIKVGDDLYVETNDGEKLHFVVSDVELYPYNDAPTATIFHTQDGEAHLNLITCDGAWVAGQRTYDHRLVVFTKLVNN